VSQACAKDVNAYVGKDSENFKEICIGAEGHAHLIDSLSGSVV